MVTTRTLSAGDFDAIFAAFTDAFSDYVIPFSPAREQLEELLTRRGYVAEASVGIFDEERMVAFTLNGVEGTRAYDSGTGVVISHRKRGLGRAVMEASIEVLRQRGCTEYVLEVIDTNAAAVELYRGLGFTQRRALQSWSYGLWVEGASARKGTLNPQLTTPSWQNSDASLARARAPHLRVGDCTLFPSNSDFIPRGTVTTELLREAAAIAEKPLRILNLDEADREFATFLESAGATRLVRQLELVRKL